MLYTTLVGKKEREMANSKKIPLQMSRDRKREELVYYIKL